MTYELTVYYVDNKVCHDIVSKEFHDIASLLVYCADFNTEDNELLFDVWEESKGQFNVNDAVKWVRNGLKEEV